MLTNLKEAASASCLILATKEIFVDFNPGAIKAFKFHFPGVKITGCRISILALYKKLKPNIYKLVDIKLKNRKYSLQCLARKQISVTKNLEVQKKI
jgi:hypothetical protein